jgi:hypothetical protein
MYFPEDHGPYHRVAVFSSHSPRNVLKGDGCWSSMADECESPKKPADAVRFARASLASWCSVGARG